MATRAFILGDPPQRLWGLSSRERLARQLRAAGIAQLQDLDPSAWNGDVLLLNAGYVFEQRTLAALLRHGAGLLECPDDDGVAAALVPMARALEFADIVAHRTHERPANVTVLR